VVKNVWKHTEFVELFGIITEKRKSSTESDTKLWEIYQDITRAFFANLGLQLPFPVRKEDENDLKSLQESMQ
jgi:hypothetical protein